MRGLVIALLPVVEEEGSEYFDKVSCVKGFMLYGMVLSGSKWSVH